MRPSLIHFAPKIVMTLLGKYYDYINSRGKLFRHWFDLNYAFSMQIMKIQRKFYAKRKTNTVAKGFDGFCENFLSLIRKFQDKILYKKLEITISTITQCWQSVRQVLQTRQRTFSA